MTNKHLRRCSTLLVIWEVQINQNHSEMPLHTRWVYRQGGRGLNMTFVVCVEGYGWGTILPHLPLAPGSGISLLPGLPHPSLRNPRPSLAQTRAPHHPGASGEDAGALIHPAVFMSLFLEVGWATAWQGWRGLGEGTRFRDLQEPETYPHPHPPSW